MVARGDLAIEIPQIKIPVIQKQITNKCIHARKPVIIASHKMFQLSMIDHPRPTRAEISDIANAVYDGTDAMMLSGETAFGHYAPEAVKVMVDTAREIEADKKDYKDIPSLLSIMKHRLFARSSVIASAKNCLRKPSLLRIQTSDDYSQSCSSIAATISFMQCVMINALYAKQHFPTGLSQFH